ncbi:MAG: hypothetical protein Ct9H300mP11_30390 [Chloroflexota bacterium]|nr:MAG: hypothetical protein Ct9H300mP11_30390 [Chloroflexota bacterium]
MVNRSAFDSIIRLVWSVGSVCGCLNVVVFLAKNFENLKRATALPYKFIGADLASKN